MSREEAQQQVLHMGDYVVSLPPDVTAAQWALERIQQQNPRIRGLLGCIQLLDGVLESNYAILHCSPQRLLDIWGKVRRVAHLLRTEVEPLLRTPSRIPKLEAARSGVQLSLSLLERQVLRPLGKLPDEVPDQRHLELRKMLCVSIGQLHVFLQESFGELMASDPRSQHDADYFLSRRFTRDIEEAEWLYRTVERLEDSVRGLLRSRPPELADWVREMRRGRHLPTAAIWEQIAGFLGALHDGLTPKLQEVLALRGIRFDEMEILDRYAIEIPVHCRVVEEIYGAGLEAAERIEAAAGKSPHEQEQAAGDVGVCHAVGSRRLADRLFEVNQRLEDLEAFVPLWLSNIRKRRALMFRSGGDGVAAGVGR